MALPPGPCRAASPQRQFKMRQKAREGKGNDLWPESDFCRKKSMIDLLIEALIPNVRMFLVSNDARDRT